MIKEIDLNDIEAIALEAGNTIMEIYNRDFSIEYKDDKSPLTEADIASNKVIINALEKYNFPIMSEEEKEIPYEVRKVRIIFEGKNQIVFEKCTGWTKKDQKRIK